MQLLNELVEMARKSTALNLDSVQVVRGEDGYIECPCCGGEGSVEAGKDYCNIDAVPLGVMFYGIGNDHVLAEQYFRAASPAAILAISEYVNGLEAKLSNHIPDAGKVTRLHILVESEIADFCAGLQSPGEPESAEEMQRQLMDRMAAVFDVEVSDDK